MNRSLLNDGFSVAFLTASELMVRWRHGLQGHWGFVSPAACGSAKSQKRSLHHLHDEGDQCRHIPGYRTASRQGSDADGFLISERLAGPGQKRCQRPQPAVPEGFLPRGTATGTVPRTRLHRDAALAADSRSHQTDVIAWLSFTATSFLDDASGCIKSNLPRHRLCRS